MGLTKHSSSGETRLQIRDYSLWRDIKEKVPDCDVVQVKNVSSGEMLTKYGYRFDSLEGRVTGVEKYERTEGRIRYVGYYLRIQDGNDVFLLQMPYESIVFRKFLNMAASINWNLPLTITVFKGKKDDGSAELAVWLRQGGNTIKQFFTKDNARGRPEPIQDEITKKWDFSGQQRWLVKYMTDNVLPEIARAAATIAPPQKPATGEHVGEPEPEEQGFEEPASRAPGAPSAPSGAPGSADLELELLLDRTKDRNQVNKVFIELCERLRRIGGDDLADQCWNAPGMKDASDEDKTRRLLAACRSNQA